MGANGCRICSIKNKSKSGLFSALADSQESAKRTMINAFEVCLMMQFRLNLIMCLESYLKVHFKIYIKMHKKGAPGNELKGALQTALKLHLFMQFSVHSSIPNDPIKGKIKRLKLMIHFSVQLRVRLRAH